MIFIPIKGETMNTNLWMRKTIGGTSLQNHPITFVLGVGLGIVIGAIVYTLVFAPVLEFLGIPSDLDWRDWRDWRDWGVGAVSAVLGLLIIRARAWGKKA